MANDLNSFGAHYDAFTENSTIHSVTIEWLQTNILGILSDSLTDQNRKDFAVLGVGSFNGDQDIIIIDNIKKSLKQEVPFLYSAVEPCAPALDEFEKAATKLFGNENRNFTFDKWPVPFAAFLEKKRSANSYDFIHFIHCANYLDIDEVLVRCFNKELKDTGKIMIILAANESRFKQFSDQFRTTKIPCSFDFYAYYSTDDIKKVADKHGWEYQIKSYVFEIDVTECFKRSDIGDSILEHMVKGDYKQHVTPDIRNEVEKALVGLTSFVNGKRIMYEATDIIIINKK